ncbi:MAG: helix-turn-helix domain-containing protein [Candidatus Nanohaloarchaea archaeon]
MKKDSARCIGLRLAEGDTKTEREVTFTNNCFELVELFYRTIRDFSGLDRFRLYVYRPNEGSDYNSLEKAKTKFYFDERATQTYYLLRLASTDFVKKWKNTVEKGKSDSELYQYILQGFFAGEGSIYEGARNSRRLRISQGAQNQFLETMLDHFELDYNFKAESRSYVITRKRNWDIFADLDLVKLHLRKRNKFWRIYESFQETHYQKGQLKEEVLELLDTPWQTRELAEKFDRSQARLCDVLMLLKEEGKAMNYKTEGSTYWIREDQNAIIISEVKSDYLDLLRDNPLKVSEIAEYFSVRKKSAYKNLYRLEELGLIKKQNHEWETVETDKRVIVL